MTYEEAYKIASEATVGFVSHAGGLAPACDFAEKHDLNEAAVWKAFYMLSGEPDVLATTHALTQLLMERGP